MTASRLSLWQAAWVIARRDMRAILFSKAFLLFLLGPIFFGGISLGAGMLGAKAAGSAEPARLAVILSPEETADLRRAYAELAPLVDLPIVEAVRATDTEPRGLLKDRDRNF
ncbi:MAG: ABC transporter permease, partial [Pseudomonadota bacterium]|nr:ABC transporter permease [Pseudomonadota bacterium]